MPLAAPTTGVYGLPNDRVTELMIHHSLYPPARAWLKELFSHHNAPLADIAGGQDPLLPTGAPSQGVAIEVWTVGKVLLT